MEEFCTKKKERPPQWGTEADDQMNFLNLPNWDIITSQEDDERYVVIARPLIGYTTCPACSSPALVKNGRDTQYVRDLPAQSKHVVIQVRRQRYLCKACHVSCSQPLPDVDERRNMTRRLVDYIQRKSVSTRRTFVSLAEEVGLDPRSIRNIFNDYIDHLNVTIQFETPGILGIDELHVLGAPRAIFTNLEANTIIELLKDRKKQSVIHCLRQIQNPTKIHTVVTDCWRPYREAVRLVLPHATLVADKFHVLKQATTALEKFRKEMSAGLSESQRKTLKMHDRYLLLRRQHDLTPEQLFLLETWTKNYPLLGQAHQLKEQFFKIYDNQTITEAHTAYLAWIKAVPPELMHIYQPVMLMVEEWKDAIFAHFEKNHITGAFVESANGLARVLNRMGRGYGLKALRARLL